jgi:hypothetical protein
MADRQDDKGFSYLVTFGGFFTLLGLIFWVMPGGTFPPVLLVGVVLLVVGYLRQIALAANRR